MKKLIILLTVLTAMLPALARERYAGGDISLLPTYEAAGAQYKDYEWNEIKDLIPWLHDQGLNAMRVRLFVNPSKSTGADKDPNACQDLEYITPLCKRIKDSGMKLLLDFHYSDTWADPAKQWTPEDWKDLTDEQLYQKIYDYTRDVLLKLNEAGVTPDFIQPGNEISYGMLWGPHDAPESDLKKTLMGSDANWERLGTLLKQAIKACREVCPDAKIMLHNERVPQPKVMLNFFDKMNEMNVPYDIIALSYYPYFHGGLAILRNALNQLVKAYPDKTISIGETNYSYKWEVPGTDHDLTGVYPYTEEGQAKFTRELISLLEEFEQVDSVYWWWLGYNAYGTKLEGWYNAPLFDSTTGKVTQALKDLASFASGTGAIDGIFTDPVRDNRWYGIDGTLYPDGPKAPGLYIRDGRKILVK